MAEVAEAAAEVATEAAMVTCILRFSIAIDRSEKNYSFVSKTPLLSYAIKKNSIA